MVRIFKKGHETLPLGLVSHIEERIQDGFDKLELEEIYPGMHLEFHKEACPYKSRPHQLFPGLASASLSTPEYDIPTLNFWSIGRLKEFLIEMIDGDISHELGHLKTRSEIISPELEFYDHLDDFQEITRKYKPMTITGLAEEIPTTFLGIEGEYVAETYAHELSPFGKLASSFYKYSHITQPYEDSIVSLARRFKEKFKEASFDLEMMASTALIVFTTDYFASLNVPSFTKRQRKALTHYFNKAMREVSAGDVLSKKLLKTIRANPTMLSDFRKMSDELYECYEEYYKLRLGDMSPEERRRRIKSYSKNPEYLQFFGQFKKP